MSEHEQEPLPDWLHDPVEFQPTMREWTPTDPNEPATGHGNKEQGGDPGVTKREYFAIRTLQGYLASGFAITDKMAKDAVRHADLLIDALNEEQDDVEAEMLETLKCAREEHISMALEVQYGDSSDVEEREHYASTSKLIQRIDKAIAMAEGSNDE